MSTFEIVPVAADLAERVNRLPEFVPKGFLGRQEAVLAAILVGHEMGIGPMESLSEIAIIDGKPTFSAKLMRAQILRHGHELWVDETTTTRAIVCGQRADSDKVTRVTWTMDDARRANLAGKQNWQRYPRQMLVARATAELCRLVFPDVLGSARFATEELTDDDLSELGSAESQSGNGTQPPSEAPKRRTARRKSGTQVIDTTADVAPAVEPQSEPPPEPSSDDARAAAQRALDEGPPLGDESSSGSLAPMTDAQRHKLMALARELSLVERDHRLRLASLVAARDLGSTNDLTLDEASALIDVMERTLSGGLVIVRDAEGMPVAVTPAPLPDEPDDDDARDDF